jgi:hypothetical protein
MPRVTKITEKWHAVQPEYANGWWIVSTDPEGGDCIDESGDGGFEESTARFIASAPEMAKALEMLIAERADKPESEAVRYAKQVITQALGEAT